MTWIEHHTASSRAAADAEVALRQGAGDRAAELYRAAAEAEERALAELDPAKTRTLGITAVSAVALWYKGHDFARARELADRLDSDALPPFARTQLREIVDAIEAELDVTLSKG